MTTLLVDGHHLIHRVAFIRELQELKTSDGKHVGPVFGFLRVLRGTLERFKATSCIVAWDSPGGSVFRKDLYPDYKANRNKDDKPEALDHIDEQKADIQGLLPYLSVKQVSLTGLEGDDILWLLIRHLPEDEDIVVVSEDKDLLQLVGPNVSVFRPIQDKIVDEDNFEDVTGVELRLFTLKKALVGDTSDNIMGIKGVGEKTAEKLIREVYYDEEDEDWYTNTDIELLKMHCAKSKTKTAQRIVEDWDVVKRNMDLVDLTTIKFSDYEELNASSTIEADANLHISDVEVIQALGEFEFNSLAGVNYGQWILPFRRLN